MTGHPEWLRERAVRQAVRAAMLAFSLRPPERAEIAAVRSWADAMRIMARHMLLPPKGISLQRLRFAWLTALQLS